MAGVVQLSGKKFERWARQKVGGGGNIYATNGHSGMKKGWRLVRKRRQDEGGGHQLQRTGTANKQKRGGYPSTRL